MAPLLIYMAFSVHESLIINDHLVTLVELIPSSAINQAAATPLSPHTPFSPVHDPVGLLYIDRPQCSYRIRTPYRVLRHFVKLMLISYKLIKDQSMRSF